jgi:hypothetical protein
MSDTPTVVINDDDLPEPIVVESPASTITGGLMNDQALVDMANGVPLVPKDYSFWANEAPVDLSSGFGVRTPVAFPLINGSDDLFGIGFRNDWGSQWSDAPKGVPVPNSWSADQSKAAIWVNEEDLKAALAAELPDQPDRYGHLVRPMFREPPPPMTLTEADWRDAALADPVLNMMSGPVGSTGQPGPVGPPGQVCEGPCRHSGCLAARFNEWKRTQADLLDLYDRFGSAPEPRDAVDVMLPVIDGHIQGIKGRMKAQLEARLEAASQSFDMEAHIQRLRAEAHLDNQSRRFAMKFTTAFDRPAADARPRPDMDFSDFDLPEEERARLKQACEMIVGAVHKAMANVREERELRPICAPDGLPQVYTQQQARTALRSLLTRLLFQLRKTACPSPTGPR